MEHASAPPGHPRHGLGVALAIVAAAAIAAVTVIAVALIRAVRELDMPAPIAANPIAALIAPALTNVTAVTEGGRGVSAGTGMVLTPAGRVLTNNHVIEGATEISATDVGNGRTYRASVVGYDESQDVAVLQLIGATGLTTAPLAGDGGVRVGDNVMALGNAGGLGGMPATATGTVIALDASITVADETTGGTVRLTGLIRTTVPLQAGDSGGPLVTADGLVAGMNTAASQSPARPGLAGAGGYAIPIDRAARVCAAIVAGKASATVHIGPTARLGVAVTPSPVAVPGRPSEAGAGVIAVPAGTPAAAAGLAFGDVIVALGGHRVTTAAELRAALVFYHPGSRVLLRWVDQERQPHATPVVLAAGPAG